MGSLDDVKMAPGKLRMKCMIWEPTPMTELRRQDDAIVYNGTTLRRFPTLPKGTFQFHDDPPSFNLKMLHVYRDTFLQIKGESIENNVSKLLDYRGESIYDGATPKKPWIYHQTFNLKGSIFNADMLSPSEAASGKVDQSGLSRWHYEQRNVSGTTPGKARTSDTSQQPEDEFDITNLSTSGTADDQKKRAAYAQERKNWRFFPSQLQVSTEPKLNTSPTSSSTSSRPRPKSIHWLVEKAEDVFNQQDFFVEFVRGSYQPDIVSNDTPLDSRYKFLDPLAKPEAVGESGSSSGRAVIVNSAVVEIGADGLPAKDQSNAISLSKQPYYLVEIGPEDSVHHYYILLAYNHYPMFVHVGDVPYISAGVIKTDEGDGEDGDGEDGDSNDESGTTQEVVAASPVLVKPGKQVSTVLSEYDVACSDLMNGESLRITVRNHLGNIVVYFNDNLSKPWVIRRSDFRTDDRPATDQGIGDLPKRTVYMRVPEGKIRIAAGNMLCGFMYGPLHYKEIGRFALPDAVCVKGAVKETDVSCYLREKESRDINGKRNVPRFFQDADIFKEFVSGKSTTVRKVDCIDRTTSSNGYFPETFSVRGYSAKTNNNRNFSGSFASSDPLGPDGKYSYIRINKTTKLSKVQNPVDGEKDSGTIGTPKDGIKYFRAEYILGAGDATVGKDDPKKKWTIPNCLTPIANGWSLVVNASQKPRVVCPVYDVAHHVLNFSAQSTFSDMIKVEHSGSIKFLVNFGSMTGSMPNSQDVPLTCGDNPADPYAIDRSKDLAALVDKTFMVRIYAWWEGGYMDCSVANCWCKRSSSEKKVIFTGMCHGGQITIEAGKRIMECQLVDYWKILEDGQFLNSPFFDGMRDYNAVHEVLQLSGFLDDKAAGGQDKWAPGSFISAVAKSPFGINPSFVDPSTGDTFWIQDYALPSSFDVLQSPIMKFNDGENYAQAINTFARFGGKMCYFDRYGVFKMTARPDQFFCARGHQMFIPKCNFFASPANIPSGPCRGYDALGVTNYSYKRGVADTVNEIHILSTTPEGELIIAGGVNFPGKTNPKSEGYHGYTKRLLQIDGIFGSLKAVQNIVKYYSGFYRPPVMVNWESMGVSHLMAGDTVTFTGLDLDESFPPPTRPTDASLPNKTTTVYITSLSSDIDPSRNTWTNKYEGEWIFTGELECNANT